ncbi:MAG: putative 7-carboxy-7-deazaguanine synthase QueE [Lachnospiraceae bacterium]|nr:putative 7-carboxy-7-deazaguanine synthase QueE [Lachnospiraceae bacterium]
MDTKKITRNESGELTYPVVEKFISINGEGTKAGELAAFIRLRGCNLNCSYCDTLWANTDTCPCQYLTASNLVNWLRSCGVANVTLTGGEPLLRPEVADLICQIGQARIHPEDSSVTHPSEDYFKVEIETNGSIDLAPFTKMSYRPSFTMDYKCPDSGMEAAMNLDNFKLLDSRDTVKFVVGSRGDLDKSTEVIHNYIWQADHAEHAADANLPHIYFSPVFSKIDPQDIVEYMIEHHLNGVRIQLQMHKFIWPPDMRGV